MIRSVEIANFKNIRHQRIELERLTVFVGANGSGKTSVLEGIHLAVRAAAPKPGAPRGRPERVFGWQRHCDWLYSRGGSGDMAIACTTEGGTFAVSASAPDGFPPKRAEEYGRGAWAFRTEAREGDDFEAALRPARSLVYLHLNAAALANTSYSARVPPRVEFDGAGLASVLAYMALNDPDQFDVVVQELRRLIPQLRRIRFAKAPVQRLEKEYVRFGDDTVERRTKREYQGDAILFDFVDANSISAHTVSEGTLLLLGLLTVLLGPAHPNILLLDDIEHGLHPLAQRILLDVLSSILDRFPDLQILATAHSPYLLDGLQPEQVRLLTLGPDGQSLCGRLTDHPHFERWKNEMAPGELWSLFGETWIAERVRSR